MKVLVAVPVYNEQAYVTRVLEKVRRYAADVLVVDDGSTDETPLLLARQPVDVVRHAVNRGYGRSMVDALRWAQCYGYEWLVTMDCDEQHEPESLPDFYRAIEADEADVISGSRYLNSPRCGDRPPADRRAINETVTELVNERLGLSITDAFCGFKAYRVKAVSGLRFTESGYAFPVQFWVQAAAKGLSVAEIPVRLIYNDPNRSFGGPLDDPDHRLAHYRRVFAEEVGRFPGVFEQVTACTCQGELGAERGAVASAGLVAVNQKSNPAAAIKTAEAL